MRTALVFWLLLGACEKDASPPVPEAGEPDARVEDAAVSDARALVEDAGLPDAMTQIDEAGVLAPMDAQIDEAGTLTPIDAQLTEAGVLQDAAPLDAASEDAAPAPPCNPADYPSSITLQQIGGGFLRVCGASGAVTTLLFPGGHGGLEVSAQVIDPAARSWANPGFATAFRDLIELQPADVQFIDPVTVELPHGELLGFVFNDDLDVPTPLTMTSSNELKLWRLGTLGVVAAQTSCESTPGAPFTNGWVDQTPTNGYCSGFAGRLLRNFACPSKPFCYDVFTYCCVPPSTPPGGCAQDMVPQIYFARASNERTYCQGRAFGPYLASVSPRTLFNAGEQTIELTGSNFAQNGYVWLGGSGGGACSGGVCSVEWISDKKVRAVIDGHWFVVAGGSTAYVQYVNPPPVYSDANPLRTSNALAIAVVAP
jgi:hypothetical protein